MKIKNWIVLAIGALALSPVEHPSAQPEARPIRAPACRSPPTADDRLMQAIQSGDVDKAKAAIAGYADVFRESFWRIVPWGCTGEASLVFMSPQQAAYMLLYARDGMSSPKRLAILRVLFENGVRPSAQIVHNAATQGDVALTRLLVEFKAKHFSPSLLQDVRKAIDETARQIKNVGPEEAAKERANLIAAQIYPSYNVQMQNLQEVAEMVRTAIAESDES